jgi:outer membrane protein assembly factor BamB
MLKLNQNLKKDLTEILVNSFLKILLIFICLTNCSFNKNSKFWTKSEKIEEIKNVEKIFVKEKILNREFNPSLKISLYTKAIDKSFFNNYDNNNGRINYDGDLKSISRFKFSKIDNFYQYDPIILFDNSNVIFFDNKGTILKFDQDSRLIWKKNYYSKSQKKQNPILLFGSKEKTLIVADNIAKYYALDINTGELLWSKNNVVPFNSQLKTYKNKFFIIDFENTLRSYSIKNGVEIWNIRTESSLIRSQKKLSMVILNKKIYFNNSLGDLSAVDIESGELLWQSPTQSSLVYIDGFFLKTSDIIADKNNLYFSNNKNEFFSIDINNGTLNWKQKINSNLRPTLIDNYIFTVSLEGYLIVMEKLSGNIIRSTDIFKNFKPKKRSKIQPVGFIVGVNNIYLTTDNGRLLVIDITTGTTSSILKIDNDKISRPFVLNKNLYIIKDNSIIKLN